MTPLAKAHGTDIGNEVASLGVQVHGGMGFTDLLGLHYWFKRIGFDRQRDRLWFVGDLVNRGPDAAVILAVGGKGGYVERDGRMADGSAAPGRAGSGDHAP